MAAVSYKITREAYQHHLDQITLLQKYGPFGIKIVKGDFVLRNRFARCIAYGYFALSILRITHPNTSEVLSLAKKKVAFINAGHSEVNIFSPYLNLYFDAVKVIYLWNHFMGLPEGRIGRLQRLILRLSRSEWNETRLKDLQIQYTGSVESGLYTSETHVSFAYVTKEKFPLAIIPKGDYFSRNPTAFLPWLERHREELQKLLKTHKALIFKGFPIANGEEFSAAITAVLGKTPVEYHGEGSRDRVGKNVYTSTKAPLSYKIRLHNELTCTQDPAEFICFYCESPPTPGTGHTILGKTIDVSTEIAAEFALWELFKGRNIRYISRHPSTGHWLTRVNPTHRTWQQVCNTDDKAKAEAGLKSKRGFSYRWVNGFLEISRIAPAMVRDKELLRDIWFNQMHLYHPNRIGRGGWFNHIAASLLYLRRHTRQYDVEFEDGTPIPQWAVYRVYQIIEKHEVKPEWQRGDFMIVDNYQAMHGKNSSEGPRRILATFM